MVDIALVKFNSNLSVSIGGAKRQDFKKGTKIVVNKSDVIPLLRLGCSIEGEAKITYKADKKFLDEKIKTKKAKTKKADEEAEAK